MALRKWTFTVEPRDAGLRLDQLIAARTDLSRRQAREALKLGGVQVQNQRIRVASKIIREGHEVRVLRSVVADLEQRLERERAVAKAAADVFNREQAALQRAAHEREAAQLRRALAEAQGQLQDARTLLAAHASDARRRGVAGTAGASRFHY